MSKRFTDSSKFRDPWYRKLSPKMKCLWEYLLAECDLAGILDFDIESMEFHIGDTITISDIRSLGSRVYFLEESKIFIPNFVEFQQGALNPDNKAHKSIFIAFEKYGIPTDLNMDNFSSPFNPPSKEDISSTGIGNSKGISNSIAKEEKNNFFYEKQFDEFWELYTPYEVSKGSKQDARLQYKKSISISSHEEIIDGLKKYMDYCHGSGCKTKQAFRWLSKQGWKDDYQLPKIMDGKQNANKLTRSQQADEATRRARERILASEQIGGHTRIGQG